MELPINLSFDFVAENNPNNPVIDGATGVAQTGDILFCAIIALMVIAFGLGLVLLYRKKIAIPYNSLKQNSVKNSTNSKWTQFFNVSIIAVIALIFALVLCIFFQRNALADNEGTALIPDTNRITVTVSDEGNLSFSTCNLRNVTNSKYELDSVNVSIFDEAKSVHDINSAKLTINGFGGCIYNAVPDGKDYEVKDIDPVLPSDYTTLSFALDGLSKEDAFALIGKSVYSIILTPVKVYNINYDKGNVDYSEVVGKCPESSTVKQYTEIEISSSDTLSAEGYSFACWLSQEGRVYNPGDKFDSSQDLTLTAQWKAISYSVTVNVESEQSDWGKASANQTTAHIGDLIILSAEPTKGYRLEKYTSEDVEISVFNAFKMPANDVGIVASFVKLEQDFHSITVTSAAHGTACSDLLSAKQGDCVTLSCEPEEGYVLDKWETVPSSLEIDSECKFTMPNDDVAIRAKFKSADPTSHSVKLVADDDSRVKVSWKRTGDEGFANPYKYSDPDAIKLKYHKIFQENDKLGVDFENSSGWAGYMYFEPKEDVVIDSLTIKRWNKHEVLLDFDTDWQHPGIGNVVITIHSHKKQRDNYVEIKLNDPSLGSIEAKGGIINPYYYTDGDTFTARVSDLKSLAICEFFNSEKKSVGFFSVNTNYGCLVKDISCVADSGQIIPIIDQQPIDLDKYKGHNITITVNIFVDFVPQVSVVIDGPGELSCNEVTNPFNYYDPTKNTYFEWSGNQISIFSPDIHQIGAYVVSKCEIDDVDYTKTTTQTGSITEKLHQGSPLTEFYGAEFTITFHTKAVANVNENIHIFNNNTSTINNICTNDLLSLAADIYANVDKRYSLIAKEEIV